MSPETGTSQNLPIVTIRASSGWTSLRLRELWHYRELLLFLAWRDISVRYKQTVLGAAWAVIQPFFTMLVFSLFFGRLGKIPSDGLPYPVFAYAALLPWQYFATALAASTDSLVGNASLLTRVYFPRLVIPTASVLPAVLDFAIAFVVLLMMLFYYGIVPDWQILALPFLLLLVLILALGVGLWLSALNVRYRDIRYTIPFLTQFWLFSSPVAYPTSLIPEEWRLLYGLNPMVGVIEGFRWALLGTGTNPGPLVAVSILVSLILITSGAFYFRRMERAFADIV